MMIDVEALLAPVSDDNPVGEDLDGTPERYAIEEPFQTEQQAVDGEEPEIDWRGAARRIVAQFAETKDLWLSTYLMRVGARLGDLEAVVGGAQVGAGLVERYWDNVHPQLEMVDFIGRKAPFEALTKLRDFLNPLKQVVLVQHPRLGRYTIADIQRFALEGPTAENYGMFQAVLEDMPDGEFKEVRDKIDQLTAAITKTDTILTANATEATSTNFEPTYQALTEIRSAIAKFVVEDAPADAGLDFGDLDFGELGDPEGAGAAGDLDLSDLDSLLGDGSDEPAGGDGAAAPAAAAAARSSGRAPARRPGGPIASRAEASAALEAVEAYFQKNEPSSPVPSLLRRARSWIAMDFMALLEELTPDSVRDVRRVFGIKDEY